MSDIGPVRADNQDAIRLFAEPVPADRGRLYALADGIGGFAHGRLAADLALETLFQTYYGGAGLPAARALRRSVEAANLSLNQAAQRLAVPRIGTTLTAVAVMGDRLHVAHVGDSRLYLIRDGKAACLTHDHTNAADLVRARLLPPERLRQHAQRTILNRAVGLGLFVQPDISETRLQEDDRLVLCSDGLWSVIEDHEFAHLAGLAHGMDELSVRLIHLALERQADDNVSAIAIHVRHLASVATSDRQRSRSPLHTLREYFYGHTGKS